MSRLQTVPAASRPRYRRSGARRVLSIAVAGLIGLGLAACAAADADTQYPTRQADGTMRIGSDPAGSVFGPGGLTFGGDRDRAGEGGGTGLNVNAFLWRASLDTASFMPIVSADPFGGVIITDWHSPAANPGERFKVNVFILDRQLRADAIRATVFRQVRDAAGAWVDAPVAEATATEFENAILTRARELRIAQAGR